MGRLGCVLIGAGALYAVQYFTGALVPRKTRKA